MTHILDLPVEVLQLLSNYTVDLTILRLVCRAFNNAYLDAFGKEYLSTLHCFVLDPRRLMRIKCITSQVHLVRRIKEVNLTFDVLEGKNEEDCPSMRTADGCTTTWSYLHELKDRAHKYYKKRLPDLTILDSILQDIRFAARPGLTLDVYKWSPHPIITSCITLTDGDVAKIFERIVASGCRLSGLKLGDTGFLDAALRDRRPSDRALISQCSKSLETFDLTVIGHLDQDWAMIPIMHAATGLQNLSFSHGSVTPRIETKSFLKSLAFTNAVVAANSHHGLRVVKLEWLNVDPSVLLAALRAWSESLQELHLSWIYLPTPGSHWLEVFQLLYSLEKLRHLEVYEVTEESRRIPLSDGTSKAGYVRFFGIDENDAEVAPEDFQTDFRLTDPRDIKEVLQINIEQGLSDTKEGDIEEGEQIEWEAD